MTFENLTVEQKNVLMRLQTDLQFFCVRELKIKAKEGGAVPFIWNKAQQYLHQRVEDQLKRTGMVRMYVLKGRQQGISTYIASRFYHKSTRQKGRFVFILSHHSTTTETLFQMVERFHENCNPLVTPICTVNNNRRMKFNNQSQYTVGTANTGAIGRGDTVQLFHGSEVAFYEHTDEIATGVLQTVADVPGTEIFLESTANGIGNFFHLGCMDALAGKGNFEIVFIPWFWQEEYRATLTDSDLRENNPTPDESKLKELYGLDNAQLQWRRNKIALLKSEAKFKQEYPCTILEAFQASGARLIDPNAVQSARVSKLTDPNMPLILGVDPARSGDRTVIAYRRGREMFKVDVYHEMDEMLLAGKLANIIQQMDVKKCFIDHAYGNGTIDRLHELGFGDIVVRVNFASSAADERYLNKRSEMAGLVRDWFMDEGGCRIPDDDDVALDIGCIPEFRESSRGLLQLVAKDNIKKVYGKSPDIFDALMLTFAYPVRVEGLQRKQTMHTENTRHGSALSAKRDRKSKRAITDFDDTSTMGWSKM